MSDFQNNKPASTQPRIGGDAQALATRKIRPVFDAESVRQTGFAAFAEAWKSVPTTWAHIPKFEYDKLTEAEKAQVDALVVLRRMSILNCGTESDYAPVFERLVAMKAQGIAMVLGNNADSSIIASTRKFNALNVQSCQLTDKGILTPRFISGSSRNSSQSEEVAKPNSNGFTISTRPEQIILSALRHRYPLGIGGTVYNSARPCAPRRFRVGSGGGYGHD